MKWTLNAGYSTHGSHVGLVLAAQPGWCPCSGCWSSSSGWVCSVAPPGLKHATCWNTARMDGFDLPTWSNLQLGISHLVFYNLIWLNIFCVKNMSFDPLHWNFYLMLAPHGSSRCRFIPSFMIWLPWFFRVCCHHAIHQRSSSNVAMASSCLEAALMHPFSGRWDEYVCFSIHE